MEQTDYLMICRNSWQETLTLLLKLVIRVLTNQKQKHLWQSWLLKWGAPVHCNPKTKLFNAAHEVSLGNCDPSGSFPIDVWHQ